MFAWAARFRRRMGIEDLPPPLPVLTDAEQHAADRVNEAKEQGAMAARLQRIQTMAALMQRGHDDDRSE